MTEQVRKDVGGQSSMELMNTGGDLLSPFSELFQGSLLVERRLVAKASRSFLTNRNLTKARRAYWLILRFEEVT
jgi:hypothetical protein